MSFARHQRTSQRSTLVVVISGDGELLTSARNSVADEMSLIRTGFNPFPPSGALWHRLAKISISI